MRRLLSAAFAVRGQKRRRMRIVMMTIATPQFTTSFCNATRQV
jgi:hypothetical protein